MALIFDGFVDETNEILKLHSEWPISTVEEVGAEDEQPVLTGPFGTNLTRSDFTESGVPVLTISCLTQQGIRLEKAQYVSVEKAYEMKRYQLVPGDLLFSRMASVGRVGIITEALAGSLFNYHIMRLRLNPQKISAQYFSYYVQGAKLVRDYLLAVNHGATRDGINTSQLLAMPVPVPPLDEQRRIVAEIEKQFTRLDAGVALLERAKASLIRYRASVLKAACEGRLVPTEAEIALRESRPYEAATTLVANILEERRLNGRTKDKNPVPLDASSLSKLPEGWAWATLDQLVDDRMIGLDRGRAQQNADGRGVPYIKMNNVTMTGSVTADELMFVRASSEEQTKYAVRSGDLLFNTRNSLELVGKIGLVRNPPHGAIYNNNLLRLRLPTSVLPSFLCAQMCAHEFRSRMERVKKATTSVAAVYAKDLFPLPIAIPPHAEQHRIVSEVERRLEVVETLEANVAANLKRANRLRQSILHHAFQGAICL